MLDRQGNPIDEFPELPRSTSVSFSPDGQTLAATGEKGIVHLLNLQDRSLKEIQAHPSKVTGAVWSQDGRTLATIGDELVPGTNQSVENSLVRLWVTHGKFDEYQEEYKGYGDPPFESVSFQADGRPIMITQGKEISDTGNINRIDSLNRSTNIFPGRQTGNVFNLVKLSPDGSFLLTASSATIGFWNLRGEKIMEFPVTAKYLSLSPDNSLLAVTREDGSTELWQLRFFDDLFSKGYEHIRDYLKHNPDVRESDRRLCN